MTQIIEATDGMMPVGTGWSLPQLIEALDRGTSFVTTTAINKPFVHILRHYREGNRDEAAALFTRTLPYLAWAHQHIDISVHFYKLYSHRRGLFTNVARPPADPPVRRLPSACRQRNHRRDHRVRGRTGLGAVIT